MQSAEMANYLAVRKRRLALVEQFTKRVRTYTSSAAAYADFHRTLAERIRPSLAASPLPEASQASAAALPLGPSLLTQRQLEIAGLIARGYTNQRIADALVLTPGTVANHVQHILDRLGLRSRTQVAVWFSEDGVRYVRRVEL
jgi:DNA-binding NarL/FixJ family response regulator